MKGESFTCRTSSGEETLGLGTRLGALLDQGDFVALMGDLGSGKTWFTKGLALGLGVSPETVITSPSFSLMNEYRGRCTLFHVDVYRLEDLSDFLDAGLDEYLYVGGVVVLEWADRWPEILPHRNIRVEFRILDQWSREITLSGAHPRALTILKQLKREVE
ncbi:MAG: tRNA (adenosine(37)-N6)-threonylcarbamoyltransferase complex ATPase subunit type 1 TsaE [Deltaproteobacteria bacterium]|nr:tRNA (adenosine(37)-N6)-threonylcarbamoyltransferase complex ATPase subunit type 1 TsaE [Deltaproteobacteria bacterium]MBW2047902.1 tRNA (adenosine(37)-N6)-threonylcarbamoyltransferase complex ATPase subunit type 1 TsaE [Deltaproteobacteria bacterium]MBW2110284.1 tRNA (adenosine(37)-N6)-threonylcarbamoyltransferase complex ATPase subunit type 1 TsaE [Deltaproteobacteria bacterium]MBW2352061.1 tRNA (adenosine(37)-N6)-threonylcarbamoyltransferase complex ATPase subunit type 1 TsaE [Deltaproteob